MNTLKSRQFWLGCLLATFAPSVARADLKKMFILAGQSNAVGQAQSLGLPSTLLLQPDVKYWYSTDFGTTGNTFTDLKVVGGTFGPELKLGRMLADSVTEDVVIVKVAFGGTPLAQSPIATDWNPNSRGELYSRLISNVTAATANIVSGGNTPQIAGFFWMHGESDAKSGNVAGGAAPLPQPATANSYEANLDNFIQHVRQDLQVPDLRFFIGQVKIGDNPVISFPDCDYNTAFGEFAYTPTVQAAQAAVAASDPRVDLIFTQQFSLGPDYLHFDQSGLVALGAAFAASYLVPEPSCLGFFLFGILGLRFRKIRLVKISKSDGVDCV